MTYPSNIVEQSILYHYQALMYYYYASLPSSVFPLVCLHLLGILCHLLPLTVTTYTHIISFDSLDDVSDRTIPPSIVHPIWTQTKMARYTLIHYFHKK